MSADAVDGTRTRAARPKASQTAGSMAADGARHQHHCRSAWSLPSAFDPVIHSTTMDFRPDRRAGAPAAHRARVRGSGDPPARHGVGRGAAVSDGPAAEARRARPHRHPVPRGVRRRRRCRRSTTASASRSWRASVRRSRCRSRRTTASARRTSRCSAPTSRSSTILPRLVRGEVLGAWGLTEAGAGSDAAGDADDGRRGRATAGCSTARRASSPTAASAA